MLISAKNKRRNLTIRKYSQILFLMLFLGPYGVKGLHFHSLDSSLRNSQPNQELTNLHPPCFICEYQLVHFVDEEILPGSHYVPGVYISEPQIINRFTSSVFYCYKHRGPPTLI